MKQGPDKIHRTIPSLCKNCFSVLTDSNKDECCQENFKLPLDESKKAFRKESCQTTDSMSNKEEREREIFLETKMIQLKKGLCCFCSKRTGMQSYSCRCKFTFCKKHRLPEKHNCEFDYATAGKQKLIKQNPKLYHTKIEMI